jgi:hypothetical protein
VRSGAYRQSVAFIAAGIAFTITLICASLPVKTAQAGEDGDAKRKLCRQHVAEKYEARFDFTAPFLPSNATTDRGEFIDPESVPTAAYCGHCHQESHRQWRQSAHANSFRTPWYQKNGYPDCARPPRLFWLKSSGIRS